MRWVVPLAIMLSPLTVQAQNLPTAAPEDVGMSTQRLQRLSERIEHYIGSEQIAGAVTLVAREGKVVHLQSHGYRDREAGIPMEEDDIFVIMSMTKPIVSTALMMLHEQGEFLLTDPISRWLPEFAEMQVRESGSQEEGGLVPARPITVRHILTHTAGLATSGTQAAEVEEVATDSPLRARVRRLAASPLNFQPGDRWQYGSATDVVAALAEAISGQSMDDFLRERIFQPLGMNDTHYNVPQEKWNRRARVYNPDRENDGRIQPRPVTEPNPTRVFGGVAGLSSTVPDYFKFAQMVLNGGEYNGVRLLSPKTINLMISNHIGELPVSLKGSGYGFGLGYSVLRDPGAANEPLTPGSYGWGGAWGTYYVNDPTEELLAILMIQISSYSHLNIRPDLATIATQAIVQSKSAGSQKIRGYDRVD
jgi:CubicO group peptidase (beta-lactamase class C family)